MSKHTIEELNKLWDDGENADSALFSEVRSNFLLHSGDHYRKTGNGLRDRLADSKATEETKLRLTKNHTQVITKTYINNIVALSPGVKIIPYNAKEPQDVKDAQLSQAVWTDGEIKNNFESLVDIWALDFVVGGEVAAFISFNPNKGKYLGKAQLTNEEGQPLFEHPEWGQIPHSKDIMGNELPPAASDENVFEGMLEIEPLLCANVIRHKNAETMDASPFLGFRKMVDLADAKALVAHLPEKEREEKEKYLVESTKTTFKIFDSQTGEYADGKGQIQLQFMFFRPCSQYPMGAFYVKTQHGVLFDDEGKGLPFGVFPIVTEGFDKIPSSPRSRSIIKQLRGPQAEINRMSSMISTTQITLGQDKVITVAGSKLHKGVSWSGLREYQISGPQPQIIEGRSGGQFEASLAREIEEMYKLANLEYEIAESQTTDVQAMLYKSMAQKKKYALYAKKFQRFLENVAITYLKLAKRYLPDSYVIKAVGKREAINLPEFRNIQDEGFNFKVKSISGDIDSIWGQKLYSDQILQYVGKDLPKQELGKLLKRGAFAGIDESVDYLTLEDDCIESDILALDRGIYRPAQESDDHGLYIQRLKHRMKQTDFEMLSPQIQQMYKQKTQEHTDIQAQQLAAEEQAKAGFIPSGGGLVKLDVYGPDGKRMLVPYEAAQWLVQKLEAQGQAQEQLELQDKQTQLEIMSKAGELIQQSGMGQSAVGMQQPMPPMPQ